MPHSRNASEQVQDIWDRGSRHPLPLKGLYTVRVILLVAPALSMMYFFIRVGIFPVGAVPLVYLVAHGWLASVYRADRSVLLIYWLNALSAIMAAGVGIFFAYVLFAVHGPGMLIERFGTVYAGVLLTIMLSFVVEFFFSLLFYIVLRGVIDREGIRDISEADEPPRADMP